MPFPDAGTLAVFAAAAVALLVIPGPAVLYIVTQSIEHGRGAGLVSMLGVQVGGLVHVTAAALGLSPAAVKKRLERGRYHFPTPTDRTLELTATEFAMILDGIDYPSARRYARYSRPQA